MQEGRVLGDTQINRDLLRSVLATPRWYWLAVGALGIVVLGAFSATGFMINQGLGVTGLNRPVAWGFMITNFVFWIGISHAGTLISAILRLVKAGWRRPVTRCAEVITVFALMIGAMFPLVHLGRPWLAFDLVDGRSLRRRQRVQPPQSHRLLSRGAERAEDAQPSDAAVGINVQAQMRRRFVRQEFRGKAVQRIRAQRRAREQFFPGKLDACEHLRRGARGAADIDRAALRKIALVVRGVHLDAGDGALGGELHDRPIMAWAAAALGFPAVTHIARRAGRDEIVRRAEEHIARGDGARAVLQSS